MDDDAFSHVRAFDLLEDAAGVLRGAQACGRSILVCIPSAKDRRRLAAELFAMPLDCDMLPGWLCCLQACVPARLRATSGPVQSEAELMADLRRLRIVATASNHGPMLLHAPTLGEAHHLFAHCLALSIQRRRHLAWSVHGLALSAALRCAHGGAAHSRTHRAWQVIDAVDAGASYAGLLAGFLGVSRKGLRRAARRACGLPVSVHPLTERQSLRVIRALARLAGTGLPVSPIGEPCRLVARLACCPLHVRFHGLDRAWLTRLAAGTCSVPASRVEFRAWLRRVARRAK